MILYHGSYLEITKPDLQHSRANVDFGLGFYTTPLREQAEKWCAKFKRRGRNGVISSYTFDRNKDGLLKILEFDTYSEEWLDFNKVFNTVELYFDGLIDKTEAIGRLRYEKPNLQICFRTERALQQLHFEGSEKV